MLLGMSPVRISFAGGGTDMPEYYEKHGGIVITSTINHFTYVIVNKRKDDKLQILYRIEVISSIIFIFSAVFVMIL